MVSLLCPSRQRTTIGAGATSELTNKGSTGSHGHLNEFLIIIKLALEWIKKFQTQFNDLSTLTMRDFRRPFDTTQHGQDCRLNLDQPGAAASSSCTCCKRALSFAEASRVKDKATSIRPGQAQKDRDFKNVPWTACQGIENWKELFGLQIDKAALSSDHLKEMIKQASMLIDSLQKELLKARAETKCAEDRETILKLKLEQETERLRKAQETLNATAKDRAGRAREACTPGPVFRSVHARPGLSPLHSRQLSQITCSSS